MRELGIGLRRVLRGRVLVQGDEEFEAISRPWDAAVDQRVVAVVEAADAADVSALVRYARQAGLAVATQPNGHAPSAGFEGTILLRTRLMNSVEVRPGERIARVGPAATWGDVLAEAGKHELVALAGSTAVVSATAFTLGGGVSWFGRKYGFAANSVRSFDVVDADGAQLTVTRESDPELFWALRGGGGDFAIVTAMEFDLHPGNGLYGGRILWPATRAAAVMAAFREVTAQAPDGLSVWFTLLQFPPFPELPEPLRGLSAVAIDVASLDGEGHDLLRAFEAIPGVIFDTRGPLAAADLGAIAAEPTDPTDAFVHSELLTDLDDAAAAALLMSAGPGTVAPLVSVQVRHLGGALSVVREDAGAAGHIAEPYMLSMVGVLFTPEMEGPVRARQEVIASALAFRTSGRKPFTFLSHDETAAHAFPASTLARLRDIKRRRDPAGVFRSNHPVLG
ncbi:FAD-binding oxidoreductase [Streptosporangiaceae bacterium NEAU-GS5]|nr:FAD-binding oxidoreductase [Streptosporangiaceae bacterium NEAU-GS5]